MISSRMATTQSGLGERLQRKQQRRMMTIKGTLFVLGLVTGAYVGFYIATNDFDLSAPWPPAIAATLAILYVVAMFVGSHLMEKSIDEVERYRSYKAVAFAGAVYLVAYPVWFLLWKGGFVVEPIHWLLFLAFWGSLLGGAIYYRFR